MEVVAIPVTKLDQLGGQLAGLGTVGGVIGNAGQALRREGWAWQGVLAEGKRSEKREGVAIGQNFQAREVGQQG